MVFQLPSIITCFSTYKILSSTMICLLKKYFKISCGVLSIEIIYSYAYLETYLQQICYGPNKRHMEHRVPEDYATCQTVHLSRIPLHRYELYPHLFHPCSSPILGFWVNKERQLLPQYECNMILQHIL